jgi:hypothetical protein
VQVEQIVTQKGGCCGYNVSAEADRRSPLKGEQMGAHDILEIDAPVEIFVRFDVVVLVRVPDRCAVVLLRKKARSSQDEARQAMVAMEELAKVLRSDLRHAVDVLGSGRDVFGHPNRWNSGRGRQSPAEGAGRAREDKGSNADRRGFFKEIECARILVSTKSCRP